MPVPLKGCYFAPTNKNKNLRYQMKKNLFFYLFAVLCTVSLFTSCSDDDEPTVTVPGNVDVAGDYKGTLDVKLVSAGIETPAGTVPSQLVSVIKSGENTVDLKITDFSFSGMPLGDVELNGCQLTDGGNGKYTFTATESSMELAGVLVADVKANGTFANETLAIDLDINNIKLGGNAVPYTVKAVYEGTKQSGSESSEAKILSFVFDKEVAAVDSLVVGDVVINEESKTITFMVADTAKAEYLTALVPTIEVSEKATVTPASGVAQDFSNGKTVTYTVTAENGTTVEYVASISGNASFYDFESWSYGSTMYPEEQDCPILNGWACCNDAVLLIKKMGALGGITYEGEYPVRPSTDDVHAGEKALLLESVDTKGGNIFGTPVPKVTAATAFLGTFNAFGALGGDPMATTSFGVMYDKQPLKVTGFYKYTPGAEFYNANGELQAGVTDKCSLSAVLYEVSSEDETLNGGNIYTSDKIVAKAVFTNDKAVESYAPFELNLEYVKDYDSSKLYKFAVIFSASADGASYNAAVGSKLLIDDVTIINK